MDQDSIEYIVNGLVMCVVAVCLTSWFIAYLVMDFLDDFNRRKYDDWDSQDT